MLTFKGVFGFTVFLGGLSFTLAGSIEYAKEMHELNMNQLKKCAKENNLSKDVLGQVMEAFLRNADLPDFKDLKCFTACQLTGMNMMTEDGYIDWDKMIAFKKSVLVDPAMEKKIIEAKEHCINIELPSILKGGEDKCKKSYEVLNCYYRNARKMNIKTVDAEVTS